MSGELLQHYTLLSGNAYRVLGLPCTASLSDIQRTAALLLQVAKQGWTRRTPWDLPLLGPIHRTEGAIQDAVGRLLDPRQRLRERLFWFSQVGDGFSGESYTALLETASVWTNNAGANARHAAILLRLTVGVVEDQDVRRTGRWNRLIADWVQFVQSKSYWELVRQAELGFEVPARADEIEQVQRAAGELFTDPLLSFARERATVGDYEGPGRILGIFDGLFAFDRSRQVQRVLGPLEDDFERTCTQIAQACWDDLARDEQHTAQNDSVCRTALARFSTEVSPLVALVKEVADADSGLSRRIRARAADCLRRLAGALTWANQFVEAEGALQLAGGMAIGTSVALQIDQDLGGIQRSAALQRKHEDDKRRQLEEDARFVAALESPEVYDVRLRVTASFQVPGMCVCCLGPSHTVQTLTASYSTGNYRRELSVDLPICHDCQRHVEEFRKQRIWAGVIVALLAIAAEVLVSVLVPAWSGTNAFLTALMLTPSYVWVARRLFPLSELSTRHACRHEAAEMSVFYQQTVRLRFWHGKYAAEFARVNGLNPPAIAAVKKVKHSVRTVINARSGWGVLLASLIPAAMLAVLLSSAASPSTPTMSGTTPSTGGVSNSTPTTSELKARIAAIKPEVTQLESQLRSMDQQLDAYQTQLSQTRGTGDSQQYNNVVDQYNALLSQRNRVYQDYKRKLDQHNQWVDQYNDLIRR